MIEVMKGCVRTGRSDRENQNYISFHLQVHLPHFQTFSFHSFSIICFTFLLSNFVIAKLRNLTSATPQSCIAMIVFVGLYNTKKDVSTPSVYLQL